MNMRQLADAGATSRRLPGVVRRLRRVLFLLMYPYFAAILGEVTALRQRMEAIEALMARQALNTRQAIVQSELREALDASQAIIESDMRAIRNRLAAIEDGLSSVVDR